MAGMHTYRVEQVFRPASPDIPGIFWAYDVRDTLNVRTVYRASNGDELTIDCGRWNLLRKPLFSERSRGGLSDGGESRMGSTGPTDFRVDTSDYEGVPVWVLSYSFKSPSIEGPISVYRVEWIERATGKLLRQEQWVADPFGATGQTVTVITWDEGAGDVCPAPRPALDELVAFPAEGRD